MGFGRRLEWGCIGLASRPQAGSICCSPARGVHRQLGKACGSETAESHVLLFENDDYSGQFIQLTDALQVIDPPTFETTQGKTGSALLVASGDAGKTETRVSMVGNSLGYWNNFLDSKLPGTGASKKGEPTFTWEMFPETINGLDPNSFYLKVYQPLHISVPGWLDYSASLTFYITLVAVNGEIVAQGVLATTWVESGLKHDKIYKMLNPEVQDGLFDLQIQLDLFFLDLNSKNTYTDVYLLPGSLPLLPGSDSSNFGTGTILGNTNDDVTIVLEQSTA